ncbi:hypothetical protein DOM22_19060 [Bdellovibrio sp. ZAP7]|uniref:hypothetical protein n=1 Tax=Bdellovibrio sp. ZAP7 TaxID=2231053 RepID=UPI00115AE6E0|nr:hypothetical protein [Bdellovibrio sp. ZAP7]QDK47113.1 hypothetical protein DOM22_19060 [Bdellovibrio sp. ZAP7]
MSIVQVLVGFGLATILGLVLAEMGVNSNKQAAQIRNSMERAAITQSLQSIISSSEVCKTSVRLAQFGPPTGVPTGEAGVQTIRVGFYLDSNKPPTPAPGGQKVPIIEGMDVPGFGLTTEWVRAFDPVVVPTATLTPPATLYVATVKAKFKPKTMMPGSIDLKSVDIGKVFFITNNTIAAGGTVSNCFGNNAGAYVCPNGETQVVENGFWTCKSIQEAYAKACGNSTGQMMKTTGGGTAQCQTFYEISNQSCEGYGGVTTDTTCKTRACTAGTQSLGGGSQTVTIPGTTIPSQTIPGTTIAISSGGSGTNPSSSTSYYTVPSHTIPAFTIPDRTATVNFPASSAPIVKFYNCSGGCDQVAAVNCNNKGL